jgi:osmoprotectant transport system permease protein
MIAYWQSSHNRLITALLQHLQLVGLTLLFSIILASLLMILLLPHKKLADVIVNILGGVYSIPSLAFFSLLIPVMGIGSQTAIFVLTLYNQFLLARNFLAGFNGVDPALVEAATGMGMTRWQVLYRVQLPLAAPAILAGIRLALISTVGIATIASVINAGGLGTILFDGMRTQNTVKIVWGVLLSAGLAITANLLLTGVQKLTERKLHIHQSE